MTTPDETPEQHVHESVMRQEVVAKAAKKTASRLKKIEGDKAEVLARATDLLSNRVGGLADAVQTNNRLITQLRREVDQKPDDEEVKFITGLAAAERKRHLQWAVTTAVVSAILSGIVTFQTAEQQGKERCETNAQNINTLVSIIDTPSLRKQYSKQIADLRSNRNNC